MGTQEFYIRGVEDNEARGPFTKDQLASLAEAGQVDADTLYYDATTEQWVAVGGNAELKAALFPEKKKLRVKAKEEVATLNATKESDAPITVGGMLAAAEGLTSETKDKRDPALAMERAAGFGAWLATGLLLLSAAALLLPGLEAVTSLDYKKVLAEPSVLLGALDLFLAVMLGLKAISFYPFVRFRAALGFGYLGFMLWCEQNHEQLAAVGAASLGLYLSTVFVRMSLLLPTAILGLAGAVAFAYLRLS